MISDPLSTWLGFLLSPAAPKGAMSPMELDGFLTGIAVTPDRLPPGRWLDEIWGPYEPNFDRLDQMQTVIAAVMDHHKVIIAALDAGFEQIEANKTADYRPLFLVAGDRLSRDAVRTWIRGFGKAPILAPERWRSLAEDERLKPLLTPFADFLDLSDPDCEAADNIDALLDEAAAAIPRATILLRKVAQFSASNHRSKIGRNDPCPCGSGRKYKRCCGAAQAPLS
jgi:uncharacterized protein